jgi:uncharacterized protein YndB with AHSA1/START domain
MEFTTREDIEAPIEYVFEHVTDFASFERSIMRRGGDVERVSGGDAMVGTKWQVKFLLRGAERVVNAEVVAVEAPNAITINVTSKSADATLQVDLVALSPARTRLNVNATAAAKSIPAKLLFQSVKFARAKNKNKFNALVASFADDVETRYRS